ncbi:MAG: transposase [Alphaproteobacteria bacterium]|nr:transposase [Alphaproteobacteria bacterium]
MDNYGSGSHTVRDCKVHLVWVTTCRYPVFGGDVGQRCRELLREIVRSKEMSFHAGSMNRNHVRMLLSIPSKLTMIFRLSGRPNG